MKFQLELWRAYRKSLKTPIITSLISSRLGSSQNFIAVTTFAASTAVRVKRKKNQLREKEKKNYEKSKERKCKEKKKGSQRKKKV